MKTLVTGGGGFLGSHLVERLEADGHDVFVARRADYDLTRWDDAERLFKEARPERVFHLAGEVGGIGANRVNPGRFWYANLMMGAHVLELSRQQGLGKLVIAGTVCAYPKFAPVPFREDDLWNGYPEETNAPYGVAKKSILVGAQSYREQYGLDSIFLLPANLYGPRDNFDLETSHVIPGLIRKMLDDSERVTLWGDGSPTREFLYVDDCVEGLVLAAERYDGAEPVNLGTGVEISIRELAEQIAELTGFDGEIEWDTSMPNGQPRRSLDASRARSSSASRRARPCAKGSSERSRGTASTPARRPARRRELAKAALRPRSVDRRHRAAPPRDARWSLRSGPHTCSVASSPCSGWPCSPSPSPSGTTAGSTTRAATSSGTTPVRTCSGTAICRRPSSATAGRSCCCPSPAVRRPEPRLRAAGDRPAQHSGPAAGRAALCLRDRRRIAGRLFGYFAALLWIALPYFGILFVEPGYHQKYTELTIPQLLGLTSVPDFPARSRSWSPRSSACGRSNRPSWQPAAAAGFAAGWSIAIKPSNAIFLVAPALLLLVERRRALSPFVRRARARAADARTLEVPRAGRARCGTRGAGAARSRSRGPARPDSQPEPEQLGSLCARCSTALARALLGRARASNGCRSRARSRCSRDLDARSCWSRSWFVVFLLDQGHATSRPPSTTRASSAS